MIGRGSRAHYPRDGLQASSRNLEHTASAQLVESPETHPCRQFTKPRQPTVDELYLPTKNSAGLTLRTFDVQKRQWSIYWVSSMTGKLDPIPVVGGFQGDRGEFYAQDEDNHRPVKVQYTWDKIDRDHARWQQAFSYDNRTWETNWTADFTRADASTTCNSGRPKRSQHSRGGTAGIYGHSVVGNGNGCAKPSFSPERDPY
jgi:hypothetical protein